MTYIAQSHYCYPYALLLTSVGALALNYRHLHSALDY